MNEPALFYFHIPLSHSGKIDREAGVIRGVAVITSGVTAKGHNLEVDEQTVNEIIACGREKGKVQVKFNHKSGVENIGGYLTNFRKEGGKGVADWHLLKSHEEYEKTLEKAESMPGCFGLSASFAGPEKGERIGRKNYARCSELIAVDCVPNPAANPTGLFSAKEPAAVDNPGTSQMPKEPASTQELSLADIMAAVEGLKTHVDSRFQEIEGRFEQEQPFTAEELEAGLRLSDEQIAAQFDGATREQVQATLDAMLANADPDHDPNAPEPGEEGAPASAEAVAALGRQFRSELHNLATRVGATQEAEDQAAINHHFEVLENKYDALVELSEKKDLQIAALQRSLRLSTPKAAAPGAGDSVRMFSADESDENLSEFEKLVSKHVKELSAKEPSLKPGALRMKAIRLAQKENPHAFAQHQEGKGIVNLAGK